MQVPPSATRAHVGCPGKIFARNMCRRRGSRYRPRLCWDDLMTLLSAVSRASIASHGLLKLSSDVWQFRAPASPVRAMRVNLSIINSFLSMISSLSFVIRLRDSGGVQIVQMLQATAVHPKAMALMTCSICLAAQSAQMTKGSYLLILAIRGQSFMGPSR